LPDHSFKNQKTFLKRRGKTRETAEFYWLYRNENEMLISLSSKNRVAIKTSFCTRHSRRARVNWF